jgi:endoribonuclease Dicer
MLPSEPTSVLVPEWKVNEIFDLTEVNCRYLNYLNVTKRDPNMHYFQCKLTFPLNSPLREEMIGPVMPSKRLAKRIVALEACAKLHQIGELDDEHLLPKKKRSTEGHEDETVSHPRPLGFQFYRKRTPEIFENCPPQPGTPCHLYLLSYQVIVPVSHQTFDPDSASRRIGFITSRPMPELNPFRIFTRIGQVKVSFRAIDDNLVLDQQSIELFRKFQSYLCIEVLGIEANDIRFDPASATHGYLAVPIRLSDMQIDLSFIEQMLDSPVNRNSLKTMKFHPIDSPSFQVEMFQDAMVKSCHNANESFYYVEEVSWLTPQSPFPNEAYRSFSEFYEKRHKYRIRNTNQRLLRVSKESEQRNALMPK